jgi:hypothetical protein
MTEQDYLTEREYQMKKKKDKTEPLTGFATGDHRNVDELLDEIANALEGFGVHTYNHPFFKGSDMHGLVFSKAILDDTDLQRIHPVGDEQNYMAAHRNAAKEIANEKSCPCGCGGRRSQDTDDIPDFIKELASALGCKVVARVVNGDSKPERTPPPVNAVAKSETAIAEYKQVITDCMAKIKQHEILVMKTLSKELLHDLSIMEMKAAITRHPDLLDTAEFVEWANKHAKEILKWWERF